MAQRTYSARDSEWRNERTEQDERTESFPFRELPAATPLDADLEASRPSTRFGSKQQRGLEVLGSNPETNSLQAPHDSLQTR